MTVIQFEKWHEIPRSFVGIAIRTSVLHDGIYYYYDKSNGYPVMLGVVYNLSKGAHSSGAVRMGGINTYCSNMKEFWREIYIITRGDRYPELTEYAMINALSGS